MKSKSNLRKTVPSLARIAGLWLDKRGRRVCSCTGYWFPHRRGGGACEHSKTRNIHLARRIGDPELLFQALVDFAFDNPGAPADVCPF